MAITFTKLSSSPKSLKYSFVLTGPSDNGSKTATALIADCAAGPLKNLLKQANAGLNAGISGLTWIGLSDTKMVSIYTGFSAQSGADVPVALASFQGSSPNSLVVQGVASGGSTFTGWLELRFWGTDAQ